jgi:hypothetical protein
MTPPFAATATAPADAQAIPTELFFQTIAPPLYIGTVSAHFIQWIARTRSTIKRCLPTKLGIATG